MALIPRSCVFACLTFFALALPLHDRKPAAGQAANAGAAWIVTPIDGTPVEGTLVGVEAPWTLIVQPQGAKQPTRLPADSLYQLSRERSGSSLAATFAYRAGAHVFLANGDHLPAEVGEASDEAIRIRSRLLGELAVPWEAISALALGGGEASDPRLGSRWTDSEQDTLVLTNGDSVSGTILAIGPQEIALDSTVGNVQVKRSGVASILFDPELTHVPEPDGLHALVRLSDGSRLTAGSLDWNESRLVLVTPYGLRVEVNPSHVAQMHFLGGRIVYLSDLDPAEYEHQPYLSVTWPFERDRSVGGNPLKLGGTTHAKGLGMHSASRLTYRLDGSFRRFEALVGIDDETSGAGSVVFRVLVDGRQRYASPILRGSDEPRALEAIDVTGAEQLQLLVDRADYGDIQDHADWAAARLIRVE